jgi:hypothetical protein
MQFARSCQPPGDVVAVSAEMSTAPPFLQRGRPNGEWHRWNYIGVIMMLSQLKRRKG